MLLETYVGNGLKKVVHPSYQAWTYKMLLKDFNQNIQENNIVVEACSILHNYIPNNDDPILDNKFAELIKEVPIFFQNDEEKINLCYRLLNNEKMIFVLKNQCKCVVEKISLILNKIKLKNKININKIKIELKNLKNNAKNINSDNLLKYCYLYNIL